MAPCLLGGFTIAWTDDGAPRPSGWTRRRNFGRLSSSRSERGLTAHARAALPVEVPHADAAFNAARAALLVHALTSAPELLMAATEDRLHQGYRAAGMPETAALVAQLRRGRGGRLWSAVPGRACWRCPRRRRAAGPDGMVCQVTVGLRRRERVS